MGNNKNSNKLRLRDTLLNMLGEFVALNKSPEVRLSSASQQFLADAVLEEKRHLDKDHIRHVRSVSSNAVLASPSMGHSQINPSSNSFIHHSDMFLFQQTTNLLIVLVFSHQDCVK
uniref:Uncharacterized protein n=1 Tax=Meloidogyne enterolobii TaxID=390850 RepID=A0A6V7TS01_MELEN|nr:unnamed protein product [Meloidogyne enterolobii]